MPLTSISSCYKTLPSYFAEKVTQHAKKRNDCFTTRYSDIHDGDLEVLHTCAPLPGPEATHGFRSMTKRSCTPLAAVSDNESEDGASPRVGARLSPSPRPQTSDSTPRGSKRQSPSPRPSAGAMSATWAGLHPRKTATSPRTAISLDNVDIWEEELSDNEGFDQINGVAINPRMTIDLSDLRRSRSPVATKRNKLDECQRKEEIQDNNPAKNAEKMRHAKSPSPRRPNSHLINGINTRIPRSNKSRSGVELIRPRMNRPGIPTASKGGRTDEAKERSSFEKLPETISGPGVATVPNRTTKLLELRRTNTKLVAIRNERNATKPDSTKISKTICENLKKSFARETPTIQKLKTIQHEEPSAKKTLTSEKKVKVKFNNYVEVNEDGVSTIGQLRESNNSAQIIKQKYLGIDPFKKSTKTPA